MKKLFLMGFVTLAFASCVSDKTVAPQTQEQKYEQAFENLVGGKVNANVNWGFTDMNANVVKDIPDAEGSRRAHNVNCNQWGTSDCAFYFPDNVTADEEAMVLEYFEGLPKDIVNTVNVNWSDFFVYQVHKGTTEYKDEAGNTFVASDKMNQLWCYRGANMTDGEHVNNFNNGNNTNKVTTESRSYRGAYEIKGGTFMYNSGTADFSYSNSNESGRMYNNYVIIPGEKIDPSLAGFYYVGFDFESQSSISEVNKNEFVKRDYVFTDWIVRISPAEYMEAQRIMVEDLIDSSLDIVDVSDWDFNDAVFDVAFVRQQPSDNQPHHDYAVITLWAAGGTKNLYIGGQEVHALFKKDVSKMINTNANNGVDGLAPVIFRVDLGETTDWNKKFNAIDIETKVNSTELNATQGDATQKFAVPVGTKWMKERKIITGSYTKFQEYVLNNSPQDWYNTVSNTENLY